MSEGHHYTYTIVLRWSEQEHAYRAEVPAIPGCEGSGQTYAAALASGLEAIRGWQERSGKGSSSPCSQMLMEEEHAASEGKERMYGACCARPYPKTPRAARPSAFLCS